MDMQTVLQYKNDLEMLIEDQTQNIQMSSKKIIAIEQSLAHKEEELDEREGALRRANESAQDSKKKMV